MIRGVCESCGRTSSFIVEDYICPTCKKRNKEKGYISKKTLEMIDKSMEEFKKGNVSDPVNIEKEK